MQKDESFQKRKQSLENFKRLTIYDVLIGEDLRKERVNAGFTLMMLAQGLGLSYQMVQKYENGKNRLAGSTLYQCAKILDVPIEFLFISARRYDQERKREEDQFM